MQGTRCPTQVPCLFTRQTRRSLILSSSTGQKLGFAYSLFVGDAYLMWSPAQYDISLPMLLSLDNILGRTDLEVSASSSSARRL
jgi:hypothetical protein